MPELGSSKFTLRVAGDKFKQGLATAKGQADKTTKGIGKSFSNMQQKIQGAAGKVPVVGSSLAALVTPAGLATAGIGLVVGGMAKMVSKTLDVGRRLGELREKLGVSAEAIQIYERAIEEGNGNTAAFEKTTLRLQKTIGDAAGGNKAAAEQFDALGLSFEDLANKSPEEALKAVLGAANDTLGPTDRASVLAATLGRSYADLGGFATKGSADLDALLTSVSATAVTMSGEGVTAVDEYDAANRDMRDSFGSIVTEVGMALIPVITQLFGVIKQAMPLIKTLINLALLPVKNAVQGISSAINIVSALLRGDFAGALDFARNYFISIATNILDTGAKVVGLFNKDMAKAIQGVSDDLKAMKVETETGTVPALDKVTTTAGTTTKAMGALSQSVDTVTSDTKTAADWAKEYEVRLLGARQEADLLTLSLGSTARATRDYTVAVTEAGEATKTAADWAKEWEIRLLNARQEADLFALSLGRIRTGFSNLPPAGGGGGGGGGGGDDGGEGRGVIVGTAARGGAARRGRTRQEVSRDPITGVSTTHDGTPTSFTTDGRNQFPINDYGRLDEALEFLAAQRY